jgi:hypothetical protein
MAEAKRRGCREDGIYFDHRADCRESGHHKTCSGRWRGVAPPAEVRIVIPQPARPRIALAGDHPGEAADALADRDGDPDAASTAGQQSRARNDAGPRPSGR